MSKALWVSTLLFVIFFALSSSADLYRWQDKSGVWHFADELGKVPKEYRSRVIRQELTEISQPPAITREETAPQNLSKKVKNDELPSVDKAETREYTISYSRSRWGSMTVDATINDGRTIPLLLDTGCSITTLSRAMAESLGISLDKTLPRVRTNTANGTVMDYLVRLSSIQVGEARVEDIMIMVPIRSNLGVTGLLGQNFLNEFEWSNNTARKKLVLKEFSSPPGEETYGGHDKDWWQNKFDTAKQRINAENEVLKAMMDYDAMGPMEQDFVDQEIRIQKTNVAFFRKELDILDNKANRHMVPRSWR